MSGESLRLVGLDLGLAAVGFALLAGIGLVRDGRASVRFGGLALVLGWAVTGVGASLALVAGIELTVWTVLALWALVAVGSLLLARSAPAGTGTIATEHALAGQVVALVGATLLVGVLVAFFQRARSSGHLHADVWGFWLPRAKTIFETGEIDTAPGGYTSFTHPEYPPLVPASEAIAFRFMGREDVLLLPAQHWVLFVAFVAALGGLLAGRVRPAILWPALASLALLPALERLVGSSLADEPLAELFALAGICAALWLLEGDWRLAAVLGVLLAALPLTKNEGLMLAVALVVALGAVTALRPWRTLLPLGAVVLLASVPWRAWRSAHGAPDDRDYRFADLLDAGLLWERVDRLGIAVRELPQYVLDPGLWLLTVPLALLLAALVAHREPRLSGFYVIALGLPFLGYLTIYWIGVPEIRFYLDSSAERVAATLVVFSAALVPLLAAEAHRAAAGSPHETLPPP